MAIEGFTLRDYFAGQALQALIAASAQPVYPEYGERAVGGPFDPPNGTDFWSMRASGPDATPLGYAKPNTFANIAAWEAYAYADAMIKERGAGNVHPPAGPGA